MLPGRPPMCGLSGANAARTEVLRVLLRPLGDVPPLWDGLLILSLFNKAKGASALHPKQ